MHSFKDSRAKYAVLAQQTGLAIDKAVKVNDGMETWLLGRFRKALKKL